MRRDSQEKTGTLTAKDAKQEFICFTKTTNQRFLLSLTKNKRQTEDNVLVYAPKQETKCFIKEMASYSHLTATVL